MCFKLCNLAGLKYNVVAYYQYIINTFVHAGVIIGIIVGVVLLILMVIINIVGCIFCW